MLFAISSLIILGFIISAISSFKLAQYQAFNSLVKHEMPLTLDNVYSDIQHDLLMPQLVSSLMANDTFLHHWVESDNQDIDQIAQYLGNLKEKYGLFTAFFVSESSKRYFYADGLLKTISAKNPADDWYFYFRGSEGDSELNIDPDMSNNNQLAIFINVKVRDKNKQLIGITGVGLNIENVKAQFNSYYQRYGKSVNLLDKDGKILLSSNYPSQHKNIYEKEGLQDLAQEILNTPEGTFSYKDQTGSHLLITRYVKELDLLLCIEAQTGKISQSVLKPFIINIVISFILLSIVLYLIFKTIANYQNKLEKIAWKDHLTGLCNRSSFSMQYEKEESRSSRQRRDMTIMMIDIDFFKKINDSRGHIQGDKVLKRSADILQEALRIVDIIARWGGEEFIILLPDISLPEAANLAERLRVKIAKDTVLHKLTDTGVTISIGLSAFNTKKNMDWHISMADKQLYRAKRNGRNCVVY